MKTSAEDDDEYYDRKVRSDKGLIMATERDFYCIAWIAEQYCARGDQVRRLLSRFPNKLRPFKNGELIAETTTRDQISRWVRAGWVEYKRVLADEPGYCWVTKKGLQLVDLDDIYTARMPAATRFNHIYAVGQMRLWMDLKYTWQSERRYRANLAAVKTKKDESLGPIPDAVITTKDGLVAVEAELSIKKPTDLEDKLSRLLRHYTETSLDYHPMFPLIWFYVPTERMKAVVETAILAIKRDDHRKRVAVGIQTDLIPLKYRR